MSHVVVIYYTAVNLFSLLIISYTGVAGGKDKKGPRRPKPTPQFWNIENKCVFYKLKIKVCVRCSGRCHGTSAPTATHKMMALSLCNSGSNAQGVVP